MADITNPLRPGQFKLRTLFVLVTASTIPLALIQAGMRHAAAFAVYGALWLAYLSARLVFAARNARKRPFTAFALALAGAYLLLIALVSFMLALNSVLQPGK